jgi:predicted transcriptional regulator
MDEIEKDYLNDLSLIKASKHKQKIINTLADGNLKIPSEIGKLIGLKTNHVSSNLKELKERGIIKCLNEDKKKGRLYCITKRGKILSGLL